MKKINKILIISLVMLISSITHIYALSENNQNILLINSYDIDNMWENDIKEELKDVIKANPKINLKTEYLDIRNNNSETYIRDFENLLNTKYQDSNLDMIIAVDDEAFNMVRSQLFNENSIFYKKIIVFTGVNQSVILSSLEKEYITGFLDSGEKIDQIKLILTLQPHVKTINVILDNTRYSNEVRNSFLKNGYFIDSSININFIQSKYEDKILESIKNMDINNEAILLCGIFKDNNSGTYVDPQNLISHIKNIKDIPIYTSREDYIGKGAIGGYVDIGKGYGDSLGKMVLKIYEQEKNISQVPIVNNMIGNYVVDYNQIYDYDINPLDFPKGTVVINKKPYQLLLPIGQIMAVIIAIVIVLAIIIYIIMMMLKHRRNNIKNKKLYEIAKDREQLKTDFIANMSHEFRTPLNIIRSASSLLEITARKDEAIENEYVLDKVTRINQNSDRLIRLVNNLIDITKFESGFYECKCKNENIVYVVEDIVAATVDYAQEKNIELIFDTDSEEIITSIDKEKIERVILNLLSNAIKFTNEKGKIEVYIKHDDKFIYITIKDSGIGIPKEKVDQIFHRFYQVDSILSRKSEGSGIGLCIVDEIIKMHGGKINIYSEENKGTTFEIVLKIVLDDFDKDDISDKTDRNIENVVKIELSDI